VSFLNIAHRGASIDAPENTLEAFELAVGQGADMIETDLHLTRDGVVALCHDSNHEGEEIAGLTLRELRERSPQVPTLDEALDVLGERIPVNLELKRPPGAVYSGLEQRALEAVRRRGRVPQTLFSCFAPSVLMKIRELAPEARLALLVGRPVDIEKRARRVRAEAIHLPRRLTTSDRISALQTHAWRVHVYTVDDAEDQRRLIDWGVNGIFTNVPARLAAILRECKPEERAGSRS
jgi:glycerophosphoryl diester phosphodiesterase